MSAQPAINRIGKSEPPPVIGKVLGARGVAVAFAPVVPEEVEPVVLVDLPVLLEDVEPVLLPD